MKVKESEDEKIYFSEYNPDDLGQIISTRSKFLLQQKKQTQTVLYNISIIIDDSSASPACFKHDGHLHGLCTRGRHNSISVCCSTQKYNAVAPLCRVTSSFLCVFRLRTAKDIETVIEELSALLPRKELLELYQLATKEPYSFLYINLVAKTLNNMFYVNFKQKVTFDD